MFVGGEEEEDIVGEGVQVVVVIRVALFGVEFALFVKTIMLLLLLLVFVVVVVVGFVLPFAVLDSLGKDMVELTEDGVDVTVVEAIADETEAPLLELVFLALPLLLPLLFLLLLAMLATSI